MSVSKTFIPELFLEVDILHNIEILFQGKYFRISLDVNITAIIILKVIDYIQWHDNSHDGCLIRKQEQITLREHLGLLSGFSCSCCWVCFFWFFFLCVCHLFSFLCCVVVFFSFVCLRPLSCVPYVASVSRLSIPGFIALRVSLMLNDYRTTWIRQFLNICLISSVQILLRI